jgi:hypothetical protein
MRGKGGRDGFDSSTGRCLVSAGDVLRLPLMMRVPRRSRGMKNQHASG